MEIMGEAPHFFVDAVDQATVADVRRLVASEGLRLGLHAPLSDTNPVSPNPGIRHETRRQLLRCVELLAAMGGTAMVVHFGYKCPFGLLDPSRLPDLFADSVGPVLERARAAGVRVLLENNPRFPLAFVQDAEEVLAVLARHPDLAVCLDVAHAHTLGPDGARAAAAALAPRVESVHVSDNAGDRDSHLPLGEGSLPLVPVVAALEAAGYRGPYILESKDAAAAEGDRVRLTQALEAAQGATPAP
ncbi:MAG: sugar phosphate isomerase/epimerase [Firmicutes bacterium]|nr:sugar phosphate isomerase/epimerase [Bacillota bacterium]